MHRDAMSCKLWQLRHVPQVMSHPFLPPWLSNVWLPNSQVRSYLL